MTLPRILFVDDERDNLEALKRLLRKDFELLTAESGEEALTLLRASAPVDVILSDQRMPGMNGSEFLEKAQSIDNVATRVLLTGFSDLEAVVEAVNRGHIWRYLSKPWEPEELRLSLRQAAERTRLRRSLDDSRRELERALTEVQARDWSRERLLHMLLHEFRTAPQVLEGLRGLDPGGADAPARLRFIESLETRFHALEKDIASLMAEEKRIAQIPKVPLKLSEELRQAVADARVEGGANEPDFLSHAESLREAFRHLHGLMSANSAQARVETSFECSKGPMFVVYAIQASAPLLPAGIAREKVEPRLAWPLLLEPFVGAEDFLRHSTGLRVDSARVVRLLAALGGRAEFQVAPDAKRVELLVRFRA